MKRGLCCVCAVLVCTAVVLAGPPTKAVTESKAVQTALTAPELTTVSRNLGVDQVSAGLSNRAPAGYSGPTWQYVAPEGRPHDFECSPLAAAEGEPECFDGYDDTYNPGCNGETPVFQTIATSAVIRGQCGTHLDSTGGQVRDMDWYQVTLTEPTLLTWSAVAEFPVNLWLLSGDCAALVTEAFATADPCRTATAEACLDAGTYILIIAPAMFEGVPCGVEAEYCATLASAPCVVPGAIECPPDTYVNVWQLAYGYDEAWQIFASNDRFPDYDPANGVLLYEHFSGVGTPPSGGGIEDIHWWGVSATYNDQSSLIECPLEPGNFHIAFWAHDKYTNRPVYVETGGIPAPLYEFDANAGTGLTKVDTGHVYRITGDDGSVSNEFTLWLWGIDLPEPLTTFDGWISIQNSDNCAFWWAASPGPVFGSGGVHVYENQSVDPVTREDIDGDLSWCLTSSAIGPFTGACCDLSGGPCRNTTADECVGTYDEFHGGLTCSQISCPVEVWACCEEGNCEPYDLLNCLGTWYRFYVCSTTDPLYDPEAFGGVGNLKICPPVEPFCSTQCDTPAAFSRALAGGYLYISWDRGAGDQRYVIDNFTGFTGNINRIKWWGNSTIVWDGPDCDFAQPAPFAIRFYNASGTGPNYNNPSKVYDPIDVTWIDTGYSWEGSPEYGAIDCYIASLPTTHSPGSGTKWISIASKTAECDYIWCPGPDGTSGSGQWFYDNGVAEPEPGLRHRSFCLHTNIRTGACCDELTGSCSNSIQESTCSAQGRVFYPGKRCNEIPDPGCVAHQGACCDHVTGGCTITLSSACTGTGQIWLGKDTTCDQCCVVLCPAGGIPEGEPPCGDDYVDTYNMGCFAETPGSDQFVVIEDGQTICGKTGIFTSGGDGYRDLDFYRYELTDPSGCAIVQVKVKGEFTPDVWLMVGQCFTDTWCGVEQTYVLTYTRSAADPCEYAVSAAALKGPQIYYLMVSCFGSVGEVACETPYTLEIEKATAGTCTIGEDEGLTSQALCLALGGSWIPGGPACGIQNEGACCTPPTCTMVADQAACTAIGGTWDGSPSCDPNPCDCMAKGDCNCDTLVNSFDIDPFVKALTDPAGWEALYDCDLLCAADCNDDGLVNSFDIDPFVQCLTSGCE